MTTPDEALSVVRPGMTVACGSLSAEPVVLLEALARRVADAGPVTLLSGMLLDGYQALTPHLGNELKLITWFMPQTLLGDVGLGPNVDFLPLTWVQTYRYVQNRTLDVCLLQVSEPDERGYHSVGVSASLNRLLAQRADVVIAQVNPHMPFVLGDTLLHESELDHVVHAARPLRAFPHREPDERDAAVAGHVASLIPDGATVQSGIGTIPESVLRALVGRRELLLTSQLTDAGRTLIESGACVSDGPAAIVGEVLGSTDLYKWVERNPRVELRHALDTHGLEAVRRRSNFVSINSTLEVDLFGQINSEVIARGQAGGIGGSVDFAIASMLPGARSIVALPSTTGRGRSRIVPVIDRGLVTVPRTLTQFVVTEFGIADLRGRAVRERARALAAISHPDHRDELAAVAVAL
ncbi:acetyl-CoA hydrolase/transferase family protein [Cryptosporangium aurantiacum]|uniref:Acyl-CoA hydrolase n=1 Tax=Cryptosporangium aurantiacum TaxID=134849 RepID=A0A1M7R3W7_9ACTN|nr:acetyl-CoA hydrolase/transferase C-terminal domain-containing protein [Cryptosporangium aurantiacum]SHN39678.1 Acyl-CoA hydrolase [Cryptosporangium aurantiacum]